MPLTRADNIQRDFIICPGRMFAFDMWHLFIINMELMRLHSIDLVVIYIQSVDLQVSKLVQYYVDEGWAIIQPSLRMPDNVEGFAYNPNTETTWNNQLVNFHDCLYEFRESASFISFPDWDDLIFAGGADTNLKMVKPLASIFYKLKKQEPKAASFIFQRTGGYLKKLGNFFFFLKFCEFNI